jgi:hypothetical protein
MSIPESSAVTNRNVNFKINDKDDSNTPIRNFNFGEKENPYPRFNAGIDNIATKKSLHTTYQVHPVTNQVHPVHAPAPATLPHAPVHTQVHPAYAHAHSQPPLYQKSSPNVIQESHPHDVWPSGPSTSTNQDYDEALQRGIMERSPIMAYHGNPPDYPNQAAMSYASGPYTQNLIPNPHYSAHWAVEEYHRMHPNQNARDLAMGYQSPSGPNPSHVLPVNPTVKGKRKGPKSSAKTTSPLPPHTTTLGYGHPGYISHPPPPLTPQPTLYQSYVNLVPPTPYSHHASYAYGNQSQSSSKGTSVRGIKTRNSITRKDLHWKGETTGYTTYKNRLFGIMQQNGTSYLGNGDFLNEYMTNRYHIHSGTFWDRFGITA